MTIGLAIPAKVVDAVGSTGAQESFAIPPAAKFVVFQVIADDNPSGDYAAQIEASLDGGTTWSVLATFDDTNFDANDTYMFVLSTPATLMRLNIVHAGTVDTTLWALVRN